MAPVKSIFAMLAFGQVAMAVKPTTNKFLVAHPANATHTMVEAAQTQTAAPCQCEANDAKWAPPTRVVPRCIFIDLGAADGNSFNAFLTNNYGPVANCPSGKWEAYLVEANPRFVEPLGQLTARFPSDVHVLSTTAAYDCEGTTSFYLDTTSVQHNFWGSSLSSTHPDVQKSGMQKVNVQLMNLNRLLKEKTIAGDWVMVKMDIEGAEWDLLPCLAKADSASLIDRLYMEVHPGSLSMRGTTDPDFLAAKETLKQRGVDIPDYFSNTL
mmetsp:Transcript_99069/g.317793  ORF Transcript_99069/g.317793 Transcript_99069/m.317793 type:complete len:268 (+) Transcript_99069:72-875(+)